VRISDIIGEKRQSAPISPVAGIGPGGKGMLLERAGADREYFPLTKQNGSPQ
jgi:hypothetical protein